MEAKMSLQTRKELLNALYPRYERASWKQKRKMLDEFVEVTGFHRKYALQLLNSPNNSPSIARLPRQKRTKYSEESVKALLKVWTVANQICSKRLVPVLEVYLSALERAGRVKVSPEA